VSRRAKFRSAVIRDPVYKFGFLAVRGGLWADAARRFARAIGEPPDPHWGAEVNVDGRFSDCPPHQDGLLWFSDKAGAGVIAHECFHAAMCVFACAGALPLTAGNDEPFAYYLEWLVREVTRRLW
jgi:hypothetical protein